MMSANSNGESQRPSSAPNIQSVARRTFIGGGILCGLASSNDNITEQNKMDRTAMRIVNHQAGRIPQVARLNGFGGDVEFGESSQPNGTAAAVPPLTAASSGYSSSGCSPVNLTDRPQSAAQPAGDDLSGVNDPDLMDGEGMEVVHPSSDTTQQDSSVAVNQQKKSDAQQPTKTLQVVLTDCCQPILHIRRTQIGVDGRNVRRAEVSSAPDVDVDMADGTDTVAPIPSASGTQKTSPVDTQVGKESRSTDETAGRVESISTPRSPAVLSSNRSSSSSPVDTSSTAVGSLNGQRNLQRPPRKRREMGCRTQSTGTSGRSNVLSTRSLMPTATTTSSRTQPPLLNQQDSLSSSDDETGHSSGPQRQSLPPRLSSDQLGNAHAVPQGSKWKKMKKSRGNEDHTVDEASTSAGPSTYRLDEVAADYSNLDIHSSGGSDHSRSPSVLFSDRNPDLRSFTPNGAVDETLDMFDHENAVNEMIERNARVRPTSSNHRLSETPERLVAQLEADEALARRLQQEYDAEVVSHLARLERDGVNQSQSQSQPSSRFAMMFPRRVAHPTNRRGRGASRFDLSSDEVTSSFEYTTADDDEEVLQRQQVGVVDQDDEVATILSAAAQPTVEMRIDVSRGRGRPHQRRATVERNRGGTGRPLMGVRGGGEIHSSSDNEGSATDPADNLGFLQQLTAPRRRFGRPPPLPQPLPSVITVGPSNAVGRPRRDTANRANHYQQFLESQPQPFVRLGHLRFSTDRDVMGEVMARSTEDDSVNEEPGSSGRQRRARQVNVRSTRGNSAVQPSSSRLSNSVRLRVPPPYVHITRLRNIGRGVEHEMDDYEELIQLAEALGDAPGLSQAQISRLPTVEFKGRDVGDSYDDPSCRICMNDYENGDPQRILTCFHRFHPSCIDEWLKRKVTCPICRVDVRQAEPNFYVS